MAGGGIFEGGRQWHELANRAAAILSEVELMEDSITESGHQVYALLGTDSKRLRKLVDQLKLAWDLQGGKVRPRPEPTELAPLIQAAAKRAGDIAPPTESIPTETVMLDRSRVAGALMELMDNARVHGGGSYRVECGSSADRIHLAVVDEGTGPDGVDLDRAFDPWVKREGSPGAGLGLWLARAQIELLGGSVGIDSSPTGGSTATIVFPVFLP